MSKLTTATFNLIRMEMGEAARTSSGRIHIIQGKKGWSVKKEGINRAYRILPTKKSAIALSKRLKPSLIVIHHSNGEVANTIKV